RGSAESGDAALGGRAGFPGSSDGAGPDAGRGSVAARPGRRLRGRALRGRVGDPGEPAAAPERPRGLRDGARGDATEGTRAGDVADRDLGRLEAFEVAGQARIGR